MKRRLSMSHHLSFLVSLAVVICTHIHTCSFPSVQYPSPMRSRCPQVRYNRVIIKCKLNKLDCIILSELWRSSSELSIKYKDSAVTRIHNEVELYTYEDTTRAESNASLCAMIQNRIGMFRYLLHAAKLRKLTR